MAFIIRLFVCVVVFGITLYAYVHKHNVLTKLRVQLPICVKEKQLVEEENVRLQFLQEKFENPLHLMELLRKPEFMHLKHPYAEDVICRNIPDDSD